MENGKIKMNKNKIKKIIFEIHNLGDKDTAFWLIQNLKNYYDNKLSTIQETLFENLLKSI